MDASLIKVYWSRAPWQLVYITIGGLLVEKQVLYLHRAVPPWPAYQLLKTCSQPFPLCRPPPYAHKPNAAGLPSVAHQLPWRTKNSPVVADLAPVLHYRLHHPPPSIFHCGVAMLAPTIPCLQPQSCSREPIMAQHSKGCHQIYSYGSSSRNSHMKACDYLSSNKQGCHHKEAFRQNMGPTVCEPLMTMIICKFSAEKADHQKTQSVHSVYISIGWFTSIRMMSLKELQLDLKSINTKEVLHTRFYNRLFYEVDILLECLIITFIYQLGLLPLLLSCFLWYKENIFFGKELKKKTWFTFPSSPIYLSVWSMFSPSLQALSLGTSSFTPNACRYFNWSLTVGVSVTVSSCVFGTVMDSDLCQSAAVYLWG